jgi:hypothetical protein
MRRENEGTNAVLVPEKGLVSVQGQFSAAVVGPDNKVSFKKLELGSSTNGMRIVKSGLSGGEKIIVDGLQRVTDGATVDPHPAPPAAPPAGAAGAPGAPPAGSGAPAASPSPSPGASPPPPPPPSPSPAPAKK